MRPGKVATIRLNPRDVLSVLDVVESTGMYTPGMSFASMVALTMSSVLQLLRETGKIPDRDGFEYNDRLSMMVQPGQNTKKLQMTNAINLRSSDFDVPAPPNYKMDRSAYESRFEPRAVKEKTWEDEVKENDAMLRAKGITPPVRPWDRVAEQSEASPSPAPNFAAIKDAGVSQVDIEMAEAKREFKDLNLMREKYMDNVDGISWTSRDEDRYQWLLDVCLPGVSMPRLV